MESTFLKIDKIFFNGYFNNKINKLNLARDIFNLLISNDKKIICYQPKNGNSKLEDLQNKYRPTISISDLEDQVISNRKIIYSLFYSNTFDHCRDKVKNVYEFAFMGDNNGSSSESVNKIISEMSLNIWRDYFNRASICGGVIKGNGLSRDHENYADEGGKNNIDSMNYLDRANDHTIDLIIDYSSSGFELNSKLFLSSIKKLSKQGVYVIENVGTNDLLRLKDFFHFRGFKTQYFNIVAPSHKIGEVNMVVIRHLGV